MWEISENLDRAELSTEQRYEQMAEYARLAKEKRDEVLRHCGAKPQGGRPESGTRLAARDLGIPESTVRRAQEYAALPEEVKERAIAQGVKVSQLLKKPVYPAPAPLNDIETREQWAAYMMRGWNRASQEWRDHFTAASAGRLGIAAFPRPAVSRQPKVAPHQLLRSP